MIARIIQKIKGSAYKIEIELTLYDWLVTIRMRTIQLIRGFFFALFMKRKGLLFVGKSTSLKYCKYMSLGRNCIIEDFVEINALSLNGVVFGDNVTIARGSTIVASGVIRNKGVGVYIGDDSAVGTNSFIGGQGGVEIGKSVIMGPMVKIFSENHNFANLGLAIKYQGESRASVKISDNCWIGAGVTILAGVHISEGTVIASGAVVTKSITEKNKIVAGIPARIIKERA